MGAAAWGMGKEGVSGEAVVGVKYDLAAPLCLSGRSSVDWGGREPKKREGGMCVSSPSLYT